MFIWEGKADLAGKVKAADETSVSCNGLRWYLWCMAFGLRGQKGRKGELDTRIWVYGFCNLIA
jgi:hypothetical protein